VTHTTISGVAHIAAADEAEALMTARRILGYLPQNNLGHAPRLASRDPIDRRDEALDAIIPDDPSRPYDMHEVIGRIVDDGELLEIQPGWAGNIIVGFARLAGRSVGIVAQQPAVLAGALDIDASTKAARFVRTCDCFNIPLVTFVDVPGFLPGVAQEHGGIIRHGAKLLFAYCEATVPKLTVITRKAYGGAYDVMSSKHIRGDMNFAWPTAEIAVMGAEGAVNVIYRDEIESAAQPAAERRRLVEEYQERFANPYIAAARGYVDDVILPSETRPRLVAALDLLVDKRDTNPPKKHGNIPL
jgi:propionyl-CoA carboxylase beta chain